MPVADEEEAGQDGEAPGNIDLPVTRHRLPAALPGRVLSFV